MADGNIKAEEDMQIDSNGVQERPKLRYKSYRKKYRKMRIDFDKHMAIANELFKEEHKLREIAHRIQEQNDQLLDLLLDINETLPGPPKYGMASLTKGLPSFKTGPSSGVALQELEARVTHTTQKVSPSSMAELPPDMLDLDGDHAPPGYFTTQHEEDFLALIDSSLSAMPSTVNLPPGVEIIQPTARRREKLQVTERDFATQNPISVRNWLRKYEPQMFDGTKYNAPETATSPPSKIKKKSGGTNSKGRKDETFDEEDDDFSLDPSYDGEAKSGGKGKRRKEDETYRPKGGSSRPAKRKREKNETEAKGSKKARISGPSMGEDGF